MEHINTIIQILTDAVVPVLAASIVAALIRAMSYMGVNMEHKRNDLERSAQAIMEKAIKTGMLKAIASKDHDSYDKIMLEYVNTSVPAALNRLQPDDETIVDIARRLEHEDGARGGA